MIATRPHSFCNGVHWGSILRLWGRAHTEILDSSFWGPSFLLSLLFSIDIRIGSARLLLCVSVLFWNIKCEKSWLLLKELLTFSAHVNCRPRLDNLAFIVELIHCFLALKRGIPRFWVSDYISGGFGVWARILWLRSVGQGILNGGHLSRSTVIHVVWYFGHSSRYVQLINLCGQRLLSRRGLALSSTVVLVVALSCDNAFEVDIYTWTFLLLDIIIIIGTYLFMLFLQLSLFLAEQNFIQILICIAFYMLRRRHSTSNRCLWGKEIVLDSFFLLWLFVRGYLFIFIGHMSSLRGWGSFWGSWL